MFKADDFGLVSGAMMAFILYIRLIYGVWDLTVIFASIITFLIQVVLRNKENRKSAWNHGLPSKEENNG